MQSTVLMIACAVLAGVAGSAPEIVAQDSGDAQVEAVTARWFREKLLPDLTPAVFDSRITFDARQSSRDVRSREASKALATALGIPEATAVLRTVCDTSLGCRAPAGYTAVAIGRARVTGGKATVSIFVRRRPSDRDHNDLSENHHVELTLVDGRWIVSGARVTVF